MGKRAIINGEIVPYDLMGDSSDEYPDATFIGEGCVANRDGSPSNITGCFFTVDKERRPILLDCSDSMGNNFFRPLIRQNYDENSF